MLAAAISTVEVHAMLGKSESVGVQLSAMVDTLRATTDCLSYSLTCGDLDAHLWTLTGHWHSPKAMQAHFNHPAFNGFTALLQCCQVRRIEFNSAP